MKRGFVQKSSLAWDKAGNKKRPWVTINQIVYVTKNLKRIEVPAGYRTDLYSVPFFLDGLIPKAGQAPSPAIIHDWLCDQREKSGVSSKRAHQILKEAMEDSGDIGKVRRWLIYRAVRLGGPRWRLDK